MRSDVSRQGVRRELLCLSTYPREDASVRQRFLAYSGILRETGWHVRFESIFSGRLFELKNRHGPAANIEKALRLLWGLARRAWVLVVTLRRYDAIWIHREAFPFLTPRVEVWLSRHARGRLILDFDDALYASPPSGRDWRSILRSPRGFEVVASCADKVLAGSPELVRWAARRDVEAELVPTCADIGRPRPRIREARGTVTFGWIGSWSTSAYLWSVAGAVRRVSELEGVRFLFVGAANLAALHAPMPDAEWRLWTLDREQEDLAEFDVGIMPVPDTEWNRGKCAFKLIQYMSVGIPFVASPVGMNEEIATRSGAGILCQTEDEWVAALTKLARDRALRERLGLAGRAYAVEHYDKAKYASRILAALSANDTES